MSTEHAILAYRRLGWSIRKIAAELCIDKNTVARYIKLDTERSKSDISTPGSDASERSKADISTPGKQGRRSHCEPFRDVIEDKLDIGLSAQRIYQDLASEHGYTESYQSVKRFVRRLGKNTPLPFRRIEREPGQEAQIDFGTGAPILKPDGKRKRTHVFRIVLSCSRKGYSEAVPRQTTENFIRCIENAFWYFGGVPRTLVIDNLKAAVKKAATTTVR
jgi:transposase